MQVDLIMQKDNENTLAEAIKLAFGNNPKKAYFFCSDLRDTGFKLIEEEIIDNKAKMYFAIGVDKKNTVRSMLEDMLTYTKDVYYYSNNNVVEYNSNICVFEYTKVAIMYISNEKMSDTSMKDDMCIYTKLVFDLENEEESKSYKAQIKNITKNIEKDTFEKLTKTKIEELVENREIFSTRQYVHNVKSIAELLGESKTKVEKKEEINNDIEINAESVEIPKVDLSNIELDFTDIDVSGVEDIVTVEEDNKSKKEKSSIKIESIKLDEDDESELELEDLSDMTDLADLAKLVDFDENAFDGEIDVNNELYDESMKDMEFDSNSTLDINDMLFTKSDLKLDYVEEEEESQELSQDDEMVKVKKVNLNNVTNFIYELPSKTTKGQDVSALKIPNYIQTMIPEFFELVDNGKNIEIDGANYKVRDIKVEIVDVKTGNKYTDRNAKIMHKSSQSYLTFNSETIKDINFEESDIARVIKLASDIYHIEIISKDMQEYKLWSKLCNQTFKSSTRKYGMM